MSNTVARRSKKANNKRKPKQLSMIKQLKQRLSKQYGRNDDIQRNRKQMFSTALKWIGGGVVFSILPILLRIGIFWISDAGNYLARLYEMLPDFVWGTFSAFTSIIVLCFTAKKYHKEKQIKQIGTFSVIVCFILWALYFAFYSPLVEKRFSQKTNLRMMCIIFVFLFISIILGIFVSVWEQDEKEVSKDE